MNIKRKNKSTYCKMKILTGVIFSCAVFSMFFYDVYADNSITEISDETQQKKDEINKQMEMARAIIEIKEKQGETLSSQLSAASSSIQQVQTQISISSQQIEDLNSQIVRIQNQIDENDALIRSQKELLANIVQLYYEVNQTGPVAAYLSAGDIASFIVKKDRIAQTGDRVKDLVDSIKETKINLQQQNDQIDKKKSEIVDTNQKLQNQSEKLAVIKQQRQALLTQTQGEEARYRQILQNLEKQKQELLDIDQYFVASGLSADSYPKPDSKYFASTNWFYYQWDSRWGNETIGNTRTKMKSYGCAVTAVAMVFKEHGGSIDPGDMADQPIFSGDLINWPKKWSSPSIAVNLSESRATASGNIAKPRHGTLSSIDWNVVDNEIKKGNPVIVYIRKSNGGGGHYVVIHHKDASGKYVVHDPYFGANIFLNTSRALIGAMGANSSTSIDQMIIYN